MDWGSAIRATRIAILDFRKSIIAKTHFEQSESLRGQKPTSSNPSPPSNPSRPQILRTNKKYRYPKEDILIPTNRVTRFLNSCRSDLCCWGFSKKDRTSQMTTHAFVQRAENGCLDPLWLIFAFLGRPNFPSRGHKTL